MTKEEFLLELDKHNEKTISVKLVKSRVSGMSFKHKFSVDELKKGDVIYVPVSIKVRPCVVISIVDGVVFSMPLSTTKNELYLCEANSRIYEGHFVKSIVSTPIGAAIKSFIGIFDNVRQFNRAIKKVKEVTLQL